MNFGVINEGFFRKRLQSHGLPNRMREGGSIATFTKFSMAPFQEFSRIGKLIP
jgi:hypothetical protein